MNCAVAMFTVCLWVHLIFLSYIELRRPIRIRIPMNHPSLHPGHNTISVALTDSEVLTGVLTFPGKSCTTFYYLPKPTPTKT